MAYYQAEHNINIWNIDFLVMMKEEDKGRNRFIYLICVFGLCACWFESGVQVWSVLSRYCTGCDHHKAQTGGVI